MAYSDKTYFLTKIKEDDLNNLMKDQTGQVQESYLTEAIGTADSEIDSYLRKITTVPIAAAAVPKMVKQASFDIAMFHLHDRIQYEDTPERIKTKRDAAVQWLKDAAAGKVILGLEATGTDEGVSYSGDTTIFSRSIF